MSLTIADGVESQVETVVRLVRQRPGMSRSGVRGLLRGRMDRRSAAIETALSEDRIWEGTGYYLVRGGAQRTGRGLYAGTRDTQDTQLERLAPLGELRSARERSGLTQAMLARRLGVSQPLVSRWERGVPIPPSTVSRIAQALKEPAPPAPPARDLAGEAMPRLLAAVEASPGITRTAVARQVGYGRGVEQAVALALATGELHEGRGWSQKRPVRSGHGLYRGPGPVPMGPPTAPQIVATRRHARWNQAELARRLGVSTATLGAWETGRRPIPAWAAAPLHRALDEARAAPNPLDELERQVLVDAEMEPGITRTSLGHRYGTRASTAVDRALAAGELHVGASRGNRAMRGLYRGPAGPPGITGAQLRRERRLRGWRPREVARRLRVRRATLYSWEREERPIPDQVRPAIDRLLAEVDPRSAMRARLLAAVRADPGITFEELTRHRFGRGQMVDEVLRAALAAGDLVKGPSTRTNRAGVDRSLLGYYLPGAGQASGSMLSTGPELERRRRECGLSQRALGGRLGVSKTQIGHWETGRQPIPEGRAVELRQVLDAAPLAAQPPPRAVHVGDDALVELAVAEVAGEPGISRRELAKRLEGGGDNQRRGRIIDQAVALGRIHQQVTAFVDGAGRGRQRDGYHPGPMSRAP